MAHKVYIGNNTGVSRNVDKIYLGDTGGISRKVKKGYIGDSSGKARLFYFSGYVWNRYTITLKEKRITYPRDTYLPITQDTDIVDRKYSPGIFARKTKPTYSSNSNTYNFSDDDFYSFGSYEYGSYLNDNFVFVGFQTTDASSPYVPLIYVADENDSYGSLQINYNSYSGGVYEYMVTSRSGGPFSELYYDNAQGTYIDQVISENPSAYPDNGQQGNYWYVKVTE